MIPDFSDAIAWANDRGHDRLPADSSARPG